MSIICTHMSQVCHLHVTHIYSYVIRISLACARILSICTCIPFLGHSYVLVFNGMSLICTRMSYACHSHVLVCHPYVTRSYSYVTRILLVCTRMPSVCHLYVLVCHLYVTPMYKYAPSTSLVCDPYVTCIYSYDHPYVSRMYSYIIRMPLACGFTVKPSLVYSSLSLFCIQLHVFSYIDLFICF